MSVTTIITDKMVFGGDCIAKIEGKTVFVPYAIPGEKLEVEITKETPDYCQARIVSILEPSPHRVQPFCPHYGTCGGCNMQHIDPEFQRELRASILRDAFLREGVEPPEIKVIHGQDKGYRSRFQFHNGGLMQRLSNNIIPIESCPCAANEINQYLEAVPFDQRPKGRVHVFGSEFITSIPEGYCKAVIANEPQKQDSGNRNIKNRGKIKKVRPRFEGAAANSENLCTVSIAGKSITFDTLGFFQSNMEVLQKTIELITNGLKGTNVLDMYAGCGTFSVFLADIFDSVTLVEHNKSALVQAELNLQGKKHQSFGLSGETWIKYHADSWEKQNGPFDAVVIDPPRSGMEKSVCQWLSKSQIPQVRSMSCDIATHARDAKFLIRGGYRLKELFLLDFYPQTCHIESLGVFEK